jgi:hypothetical protein
MIAKITNIVLEWDRFIVFASIWDNQETITFMSEVIAQDIKNWVLERKTYYEWLEIKEEELKTDLLNIEI